MGPRIKLWNLLDDFYFFSCSRYDGRYALNDNYQQSRTKNTQKKMMMKFSMKMQMKIKIINMNLNVNTSIQLDVKMKMDLNMNIKITTNNKGVTYLCQSKVLDVLQLKRICLIPLRCYSCPCPYPCLFHRMVTGLPLPVLHG
jgi:hypothetical protein